VIGLDTNIILRLVDLSDPAQTDSAQRIVARGAGEGGNLLNPIVLAELAWTLDRRYRLDRTTIATRLSEIMTAPEFVLPFAEQVMAALEKYREGPADFSDYLLAEINGAAGCRTTYTIDRAADESKGFTLLAN